MGSPLSSASSTANDAGGGDPHAAFDVTVVGAGIAGAACAAALTDAGLRPRVIDRGRAPGGRMASPEVHDRRVDVGAAYFTVRDDEFATVVRHWQDAGLAREWTDTFVTLSPLTPPTSNSGPMRWATPHGLRSLVRELLAPIEVTLDQELTELPDGPVVLAMPDPQAQRLVSPPELRPVDYDPVIAVIAAYPERTWDFDGAFVHDHPDVEFVADDGSRRGDGAPVLVAHTTAARAREHLDTPEDAVPYVAAALSELLALPDPDWTTVHRWTFAKPAESHDATFWLSLTDDRAPLGLAGDQWCPSGSPRVESAWRSGTDLGRALAAHLT